MMTGAAGVSIPMVGALRIARSQDGERAISSSSNFAGRKIAGVPAVGIETPAAPVIIEHVQTNATQTRNK